MLGTRLISVGLVVALALSAVGPALAGDTYQKTATAQLGPKRGNVAVDATAPKYGYLGDYWFYDLGSNDNPAFGFSGVVIRVSKEGPDVRVRMTYNNDGHQGGSGGTPYSAPIKIGLYSAGYPEAIIENVPYSVPCHNSDLQQFEIVVRNVRFEDLDAVQIPSGQGFSVTC